MTAKTRAQSATDITTNFADNTTGDITASDMRTQLQNMVDSVPIWNADAETTVASATTCDIGAAATRFVSITGTTTITSFGTTASTFVFGRFTGALTLTHNGTSLILPGAANITTVAGDTFFAVSDSSGNWRVHYYNRGSNLPILNSAAAAYTLFGNPTGSSAVKSEFTIGSLTQKASPGANDKVPIVDVSASDQLKWATVSSVSAAGSVASLNGQTGALTLVAAGAVFNLGLAASVSGNALTVAIKDAAGSDPSASSPVVISFRNATASTGTPSTLSVSAAASLTVSSGSTLGASNNTPFHLLIVGFNDAGTFRLGVMNASASGVIYPCLSTGIASSTAEGGAGAADSAGVFYTGTAVTLKAYAVLGRLSWTATPLATAGTWANGPDRVELVHADFKYPGEIIQQVRGGGSAYASGTTQIPIDDTIPQNTEGTQFYTQAITPTSQANWLAIDANLFLGTSAASWLIGALFQDSTADALATGLNFTGTAATIMPTPIRAVMLANTASSTTFKLRGGGNSAATFSVNGVSGGRYLGGTLQSHLTITEIQG